MYYPIGTFVGTVTSIVTLHSQEMLFGIAKGLFKTLVMHCSCYWIVTVLVLHTMGYLMQFAELV